MNVEDAPWEPPDLALVVGDRVVVDLSGECRGRYDNPPRLPHGAWEDGLTGTIREPTYRSETHPYMVQFDYGDARDCYSRSELRRLAAPDPRAGDGG